MNFPRFPCMADECDREGRMVVFGSDADSARRGRAILCMRHAEAFMEGDAVSVRQIRLEPQLDAAADDAFVIDGPLAGFLAATG
jgi:hypothetical protein